ncbi:MAG: hypothetical protein AAF718_01300 [Pseudomonadota bacterium]
MRYALISVLISATSVWAQAGLRANDTILTKAQLEDLLSGYLVEFFDGSKSRYASDGTYAYTYTDDGPAWTGAYRLLDDSLVCVDFDNGTARCDRFVMSGDRVVLIIENGTRFPVRNLTVYAN